MFNFLKKTDNLGQSEGGLKTNGLDSGTTMSTSKDPPNNLPELAKDIYEKDKIEVDSSLESASGLKFGPEFKSPPVAIHASTENMTNSLETKSLDNNSSLDTNISRASNVNEPNTQSVPKLDLSILKQHLTQIQTPVSHMFLQTPSVESSQTLQQAPMQLMQQAQMVQQAPMMQQVLPVNKIPQQVNQQILQQVPQQIQQVQQPQYSAQYSPLQDSISSAMIRRVISPQQQVLSQSQLQTFTPQLQTSSSMYTSPNVSMQTVPSSQATQFNQPFLPEKSSQESIRTIDDSTGFFKEFEEYIRNNGLNNDIIGGLLDKNLVDHMMFYHTTRSADMPFYSSSSELSHAIKLKLEALQNVERNWIANKQRVDLLKRLNSTIESEIHIQSEELKRLLHESRVRKDTSVNKDYSAREFVESTHAQSHVRPSTIYRENMYGAEDIIRSKEDMHDSVDIGKNFTLNAANIDDDPIHAEILGNISNQLENIDTSDLGVENYTNVEHIPSSDINDAQLTTSQVLSDSNVHLSISDGIHIVTEDSKGFHLPSGIILRSLPQLLDSLEDMDENTYKHHVNDSKNDFSNWILHVFNNAALSDTFKHAKDKNQAITVLKSYLNV